jgi:hypothetical protein
VFGARRYPPLSTAEVKNGWNYSPASTARCGFMAWYLVKHKDTFNWIKYSDLTVMFAQRSTGVSRDEAGSQERDTCPRLARLATLQAQSCNRVACQPLLRCHIPLCRQVTGAVHWPVPRSLIWPFCASINVTING